MGARNIFKKRLLTLALLAAVASPLAAQPGGDKDRAILDLELRSVTFELLQQQYFSALDELNAARRLPGLAAREDETALTLAGLYLSLGLPNEAQRLMQELSAKRATVPERAWMNLARLLYQRDHLPEAEAALANVRDLSPGPLQAERDYLLSLVLLSRKRYFEAIAVSRTLEGNDDWGLIGRYNRSIAMINSNRVQEGLSTLEQLSQNKVDSDIADVVRERAKVLMGYYLLDHNAFEQGRAALVRAEENKGRLGAGWLEFQSGKQDAALKHWAPLTTGDSRDEAVQEALIALPRAQYQLKRYEEASAGYEKALRAYDREGKHLEQAITAIEDGSLLGALVSTLPNGDDEPNWYRTQDKLPRHPAVFYVRDTLASHAFQESFKYYRDLLFLQSYLRNAGEDVNAFLSLIDAQQRLHGQRLKEILARSDEIAGAKVFKLAQQYKDELARAEREEDYAALATTAQNRQLFRFRRIEQALPTLQANFATTQEIEDKYKLLHGLLITDLASQYPQRLWDTKKAMVELDKALEDSRHAQDKFRQAVGQAKRQITGGPEAELKRLRDRQRQLLEQTQTVANEQRNYLLSLMRSEVQARRDRLERYASQAQVGIAQAYDQMLGGSGNKANYEQALASYQHVLKASGDSPFRRDTLVRMAVLEMSQAERRDAQRLNEPAKAARSADGEIDRHYQRAVELLQNALRLNPTSPDNDRTLYLLAKAYDHLGQTDQQLDALSRLVKEHPGSTLADEAYFRVGELLFSSAQPQRAAEAYGAVVTRGATSPYFEKALYMHGWSQYKSGRYGPALESFLTLLDRKLRSTHPARVGKAVEASLSAGDEEIVNDVLRVSSLALAQLNGVQSVERYFAQRDNRPYEYRVYEALAALYLEQERIEDAAKVYRVYVAKHPDDPRAPQFESRILAAYQKGGFTSSLLASKAEYVRRYQPDSPYWAHNPGIERGPLLKQVRDYIQELASYHHARAQTTKQAGEYAAAEEWYRLFLKAYPQDPQAVEMNFLLAESLYESGRNVEAVQEYERVAYERPSNPRGAEAAYAAILAYEKQQAGLSGEPLAAAQRRTLAALQRYAEAYPQEQRATAALAKAAEIQFTLDDSQGAEATARRVVDHPPADAGQRLTAWRIIAQVEFDRGRYADAEKSYEAALKLTPKPSAPHDDLEERLAAAVYKQGEEALKQNDRRAAVQHFLRVGQVAPGARARVNADYDAAANLLALEEWDEAIRVLEAFRKNYPSSPLQKELPAKLTFAYQKTEAWRPAAAELETLAARGDAPEIRRDALWQAAELYTRAQMPRDALRVYQEYTRSYPQPLPDAVEAHQRIAALYGQAGDAAAQRQWLTRLIAAEQQGGAARNDRTRTIAAQSALVLAQDRFDSFTQIKLGHPLEKSLKLKKKAMEDALQAYNAAAEYGVAEVATAATYHSAEVYKHFSKDLLESERPKKLSELELEQYNVLLEEQAYPFEEKAIALHEANARRASAQVYDEWVKKSFAALSALLPARYGKQEKGDELVDQLY